MFSGVSKVRGDSRSLTCKPTWVWAMKLWWNWAGNTDDGAKRRDHAHLSACTPAGVSMSLWMWFMTWWNHSDLFSLQSGTDLFVVKQAWLSTGSWGGSDTLMAASQQEVCQNMIVDLILQKNEFNKENTENLLEEEILAINIQFFRNRQKFYNSQSHFFK